MTITICMIVKNEAPTLPTALANWRDLADELVIVDTGSTDETVSTALAHGAQVLHYEWTAPGHKGEARNVGLDAASGDWIVVLDADEVIADASAIRGTLLNLPADPPVTGVNVRFVNHGASGEAGLTWYQMRVFRRDMYRYVHREHEIPVATAANIGIVANSHFVFEHRPPVDREAGKVLPMLFRLALDVEERPEDPHCLYMYARQLGHAERYADAVSAIERYLAMPAAGIRADAARVAGICTGRMGDRHGMYEWLHRATAYEPARRLLWVELAQMYLDDQQVHMALALARMAAELPLPTDQRETQPVERLAYICSFIEACRSRLHAH